MIPMNERCKKDVPKTGELGGPRPYWDIVAREDS
jgi:hypothetical protein